jgi:FxsC-like protein
MPVFFFSCNGEDADEALLGFFQDLNAAVARQAGISKDSAGFIFLDERTVGTGWPDSAGKALEECRVFVPVLTPSFINSQPCGREYFAFRERLKEAGLGWERVLPIWWVPILDELPPAIKHVVDSRQLRDIVDHAEHGMRLVFEQRRGYESPYALLLSTLAQMVVSRAEARPALENSTPIDLLNGPSIFDLPAEPPPPQAPRGGPKRVHILIAAGTKDQMAATGKRTDRHYYGDSEEDWDPFYPNTIRVLAQDVSLAAINNSLLPDVHSISANTISEIEEWEKQRQIVVFLVDSWATYVDSLATWLNDYDKRRFNNTAIVMPFPEDDSETRESELELRNGLFAYIPRTMQGDSKLYREDSGTLEQFLLVIDQVLHELRRRIVSETPPVRRTFSGTKIPVLTVTRG